MWLLTVFFGNMITAYVALFAESFGLSGGNFFMFFAILMAIFAVIFAIVAKSYKMNNFMEAGGVAVDPSLTES